MKTKKIIAIASAVILAVSSLAGCGSNNKKVEEGNITLTAYDKNVTTSFGNDDVSSEIIKKTGVTLDYNQASGDAKEKLNLMLASNDYPDLILIDRSSGMIDKFISAKALIPLEDLIEEYAPNIKEQYGEYLNRSKSEDGHIYGLPNWYGIDEEPVLAFMIRKDYLSEVAPEEVVNGDRPITQSEFIEYLKAFKKKHPDIAGKTSIPLTMWSENWGSAIGSFKGMFGMKTYAEKDGALQLDFKDENYKPMMKYINQIKREGLLDVEWATNKEQLWKQKLTSGVVFATPEAYWNTGEASTILSESNEDAVYLPYKVVADGVDPSKTTYSSRNPMGWDIVGITSTNPYPERTIEFLDFIASDEGQKLIMSGIDGVNYTVKDGVRTIDEATLDEMNTDISAYSKKTGVRYWTICVKNGDAKDGLPYYLYNAYNSDETTAFAKKTMGDTVWDCSPYEDLTPVGGTVEALNYKKLSDLSLEYSTKLINASSEEEFNTVWDSFMSEAESLDEANVEKIITENYQKKLKLWGMK